MGFFADLKEDLSQAVDGLMPNEGAREGVSAEGLLGNDAGIQGNVPNPDELSNMLDHMEDLEALNMQEPVSAEAGSGFDATQPEPVATGMEGGLADPNTAPAAEVQLTEPTVEAEPVQTADMETESATPEPEEANKSIDGNGGEERNMEMESKVATDETAVVTEGMSITGDIISGGSLELIGAVTGNIEVLGKLNITGTIHGNSKAAEIFAEGARINGDINTQGSVKIGQSSVVIGNISASSAVVAGAVKGDFDVHGPVVLDTTAIVMGNIKSKSVQINNGAVIEGLCSQCYADVNPTSFFEDIKKKK